MAERCGDQMSRFQPGQIVYLIVSNVRVREAKVLKYSAGFYTVKWTEEERTGGSDNSTSGGMRVRESRLYGTKEEAQEALDKSAGRGN